MINPLASYAILAFYVFISIFGLTLLKVADRLVSLTSFAGALLYVAGTAIWLFVILRSLPLSVAFPLAAGALIVGTQLSGWMFLGEPLSRGHMVGVTVICVGIIVLGLTHTSSQATGSGPTPLESSPSP